MMNHGKRVVAVAIENNKTSQSAAKWAVDNILPKDQDLLLIHVKQRSSSDNSRSPLRSYEMKEGTDRPHDKESKELFESFRVFCNRKNVHFKEILLEDTDISKALVESVTTYSIELLVLGAASRSGLARFRMSDVPSTVSKAVPSFCTVYIISKGKISSVKTATVLLSPKPASQNKIHSSLAQRAERPRNLTLPRHVSGGYQSLDFDEISMLPAGSFPDKHAYARRNRGSDEAISPYETKRRNYAPNNVPEDCDISFVASAKPSVDRLFPSLYSDDYFDGTRSRSRSPQESGQKSFMCDDYSFTSLSSPTENEEMEAEVRKLKLELKQTMEMYSSARKEALTAKEKAMELQRWKKEEKRKMEDLQISEGAALASPGGEKEKDQKMAESEAQKKISPDKTSPREAPQMKRGLEPLGVGTAMYRRYSIEEIEEATQKFSAAFKIGEGGYGPVYKGELDHTPVAIKLLRPDATHGREQFNQEVEVLTCIRHPNMVLLLGACPEYGCLVYEYMANGSLDDCLLRRGKLPALPWQLRFQIAAEIATGLLFLHQTKPEPIVHRDLKPGNILLDRNFVSKISDVGLARLVPPSVADAVTQYRLTSTAGTFCYIDPEYQQTGMLGIKSDIYSLGIMLLQIVTARSPMGLAHHVKRAIAKGTLEEVLDPAISDWPMDHTLHFTKLALKCAEMMRKDRPDLGKVVLPELNKLRTFAEENMPPMMMFGRAFSPRPQQ
ncbi:U-box domain-containing protein 35-like [Arachis stenosperma]|uniref:U-box domain-containing protein 35-like n=1 Tax=Arachis stenosperma TaxID=217475 RepID=UPI0025ACFCF5|nr:U-box domain-containing protein 35-like [Arachis stenosperma]